jgi:sugar phosphate isomerase/epimerase
MEDKKPPLPNRPFRLGTTSFIYPDHIIPNVRKIGVFFDEIELLVFESMPDGVLPSRTDIRTLGQLSGELDLTYNIHLPTDISLTDPSDDQQAKAADTLFRVMELFAPLNPTTYTLHLPMEKGTSTREELSAWDKRACQGLELLVPRLSDPGILSLETLWYSPACLKNPVTAFDLSLCIDAGHHFKYNHDLRTTFEGYGERIPVVHLHGVDFSDPAPKDHIGLDRLPDDLFHLTAELLAVYEGVVSLEVFNLENLNRSLARLSEVFGNISVLES